MIGSTNSIWNVKSEYEQLVNYTMLYDYGDECTDITGGWSFYGAYNSPSYKKNGNGIELYPVTGKWSVIGVQPENIIYVTPFTKLMFKSDYDLTGANGLAEASFTITSKAVGSTYKEAWTGGNNRLNGNNVKDFTKTKTTANDVIDLINISHITGNGYLACIASSSTSNNKCRWKIKEVVLFRTDDWQTLANKAGITANSIDDILTNSATLLSNKEAVNFMLYNCTGDFMASAIQSETFLTALNNSPYKTQILANEHWAKFLSMVA